MMVEWLVRSFAASALLGVAALALDGAFRALGWPRRWLWAGTLALSFGFSAVALARPGSVPRTGLLDWLAKAHGTPALEQAIHFGTVPDVAVKMHEPAPALSTEAAITYNLLEWLDRALPVVWLLATAALLAGILLIRAGAVRRRRSWTAAEIDGVPVLLSERWGPAVVGVRRPSIVLPRWVASSAPVERRLVLSHEAEHVAAGDSRLLASAAMALVAMPLNPIHWWLRARLHEAVETDCDARVLAAGADVRLYGATLLNALRADRFAVPSPSLSFVRRQSLLERRLRMMTSSRPAKPILRAAPLALLAMLGVLVACEILTPPGPATTAAAPDLGGEIERTAGAGTLSGIVVERQSGQPIATAQVYLEGTGLGTLTGADGRYSLPGVSVGVHAVSIFYPGHHTDRQTDVRIAADATVELRHSIVQQAVDGGTLVVRGASVELVPGVAVPMPEPMATVPAGTQPIFTPDVFHPQIRNWRQVGEAIRSSDGAAGELLVWAYIDSEGAVRMTRVARGSGAEALDRAAEHALREVAEFRPALNRDQGVPVWVQLGVRVSR